MKRMLVLGRARPSLFASVLRTQQQRSHYTRHGGILSHVGAQHTSQPIHRQQQQHRWCSSAASSSSVTVKSPKDELFLRALQVFYQREGHFSVPNDFVVPASAAGEQQQQEDAAGEDRELTNPWPQDLWGMDLGKRLRLFTRGRCGEYKRSLLKSIGFPYEDWRTYVWEQQILPALHTYAEVEGHLFVRQAFEVPYNDERWPRSTWGFKLGSHCQLLRREKERTLLPEQIEELDRLGFIWSEIERKRKIYFLPSLEKFREIFGHSDVPDKFVVPSDDLRWPELSWGYRLGPMVSLVREGSEQELPESHKADLAALDFYDTELVKTVWAEKVLPSLETFVEVYGHADISADFVIPSEHPWRENTWTSPLGYIVEHICANGLFEREIVGHKMQLKELGYRWDPLFGKWSKRLLPALKRFHEIHEHCDVPQMFQAPMNDPTWPKETWGYRLGKQVSLLRRMGRNSPDVQDELEELDAMGFSFNVFESAFVQKVLPALEVYADQYGDCNVPQGFVVPSDDVWPKRSWGIKLGHIIRNIRSRKQHAEQVEEHRERLAELGFVWRLNQSMETTNREAIKPYLEIYKELFGSDAVPRDFVVPTDDERWPEAARDFKLGDWLHKYHQREAGLLPFQTKEGRMAIQKRHRPKSDKGLSQYQEEYWNEVLLESFKAYSSAHGSCQEMDSGFIVPSEAPFPQSAWGLNLGLRLRHIRHGERYAEEIAKYRDELERLGVLFPLEDDDEDDGEEQE